jgi:hypothetical protein
MRVNLKQNNMGGHGLDSFGSSQGQMAGCNETAKVTVWFCVFVD